MSNTEIDEFFSYYMKSLFDNTIYSGGKSTKWDTLIHNGPIFPPPYVKKNIPLIYNNKEIVLNDTAEEYALLYSRYLHTPYAKNNVFNKNFFNDWVLILNNNKITDLNKCNFKHFLAYIEQQKNTKVSNKDSVEKKKLKIQIDERYTYATINGKKQQIGNIYVEPPGIFIGRGDNPLMGKIKKRIYPEDVIINATNVPTPPSGHNWKKVINDNTLIWLCSWDDNITGKVKYVWMSHNSDFKSQSDMAKFDTARNMKNYIVQLRNDYMNMIQSKNNIENQIGLIIYLIDVFAIRVGNDKDINKQADTVGATGLRKEHITLSNKTLKLQFKGKDSIEYEQTHKIPETVYNVFLKIYNSLKSPSDKLFTISSGDINEFLEKYDKNLTAKVFRTYNASTLFQQLINNIKKLQQKTPSILKDAYNNANYEVAILMNHKKTTNNKKIKILSEKLEDETLSDDVKNSIKIELDALIKIQSVSLVTSKLNYIDPRITIAFVKEYGLDMSKYFNKTLQDKFKWAFDSTDFNF